MGGWGRIFPRHLPPRFAAARAHCAGCVQHRGPSAANPGRRPRENTIGTGAAAVCANQVAPPPSGEAVCHVSAIPRLRRSSPGRGSTVKSPLFRGSGHRSRSRSPLAHRFCARARSSARERERDRYERDLQAQTHSRRRHRASTRVRARARNKIHKNIYYIPSSHLAKQKNKLSPLARPVELARGGRPP